VEETHTQVAATTIGTAGAFEEVTHGTYTFCAGHEYAVYIDVEGDVRFTSSDGRSEDTTLTGLGIDFWSGSSQVTGLTMRGIPEDAIYVHSDTTVRLEDVVITGGTEAIGVSYGGGVLEADRLRIVDNDFGDRSYALWCGGDCTLVNSEVSRNTSTAAAAGAKIFSLDMRSHLVLRDTAVDDNVLRSFGVHNEAGTFEMTGGSLTGNHGTTIIGSTCAAGEEPSVSVLTNTLVGNNVAESGLLMRCGCPSAGDDTYGFVTSETESVRSVQCDGVGDEPDPPPNRAYGQLLREYGRWMESPGEACFWGTDLEMSFAYSCPECDWAFSFTAEDNRSLSDCSYTNPLDGELLWYGVASDYRGGGPALLYAYSGTSSFYLRSYGTLSADNRFEFYDYDYRDEAYDGYYFTEVKQGYFQGYYISE